MRKVPLLRMLWFANVCKNSTLRTECQKIMFDTRDKNDSHFYCTSIEKYYLL